MPIKLKTIVIGWILMMFFIIASILVYKDAFAEVPAAAIRTIDKDSICNTKTGKIRDVNESLKKAVYLRDNVLGGNHTGICAVDGGCEVDHRISLEIGGSNDISNLIIQPYGPDNVCNAHKKDKLENKLHKYICEQNMPVILAQEYLYNKWEEGYKKFIDPNGCNY